MTFSSSRPETGSGVQSAFKQGVTIKTSVFYMGSLMSFLIPGEQAGGRLCLMEYSSRPGNEPPPHLHYGQDEVFYVLEGEMEAYWSGEVIRVVAGESLFLPRDQPHAWYILSPSLRALILTSPAGLDGYFHEMAAPADSLALPPAGVTYAMSDPEHAIQVGERFGIRFLTPEETRVELPLYPGFPPPPHPSAAPASPSVSAAG